MEKHLIHNIEKLKKEKNAIILAHYYQIPEIQDIADFVGDSYGLSKKAIDIDADIILFAGVVFMAETAKILNPNKTVLIPDLEAGCSLADNCDPVEFEKFIEKYPGYTVITYVNSATEIKAMSDIICTSGNAEKIIDQLETEKIIFAPDKNLGQYIAKKTGKNLITWDGSCEVHEILYAEKIIEMKRTYKNAKLVAHPECTPEVLLLADYIGSTKKLLDYVTQSTSKEFIVATETGILHQMKKNNPDKNFYIVPADETCACNDCPYMKLITLDKIRISLEQNKYEINIDEELIEKAKKPLLKMIDLTEK